VPGGPGPTPPTTVRGVWHPVGALPSVVYWRRRVMVLVLLLAVLGGLGWGGFLLATAADEADAAAAEATASSSTRPPRLERVVPSMARVATPTPPELPAVDDAETVAVAPPAPAAGDPCSDEMLALEVRTPPVVASGSKPTFELLVSNVSAVPCVRVLDKALQELVLLDPAGTRLWGSNDCFPEASSDTRTLASGETVTFPLVWGGLSSEPTCSAARAPLAPGSYLLRGRLDTKTTADAPLTIG
jgi:hypothetical protein